MRISDWSSDVCSSDLIEGRGLRGSRFDHALELGATVIGCRCAGFDEGLDQLQAARLAIGFALPFLIGNGDIMLCLPRRRDAQIQGGALHYAKLRIAVARYRFGFHGVSSDNRRCAVATGRYRVLGRSIRAVKGRKTGVEGRRVSVGVELGGRDILKR